MDPSYPAPGAGPSQPPSGPAAGPPSPAPGAAWPQPTYPAETGPPPWPGSQPWAGPPQAPRPQYALLVAQARHVARSLLAVRSRADRRLVAGAIAGGVCFDLAVRSGLATVGTSIWLLVAAVAILLGGRVRGRPGALLVGAAPLLGLLLFLRSSPWVLIPVTFGAAVLVSTGVSLGADGSGLNVTFPGLAVRTALALGHLGLGPGILRSTDGLAPGTVARGRAVALGRGALLGVPVMVVIGVLASVVLGGLCALYAAFVAAQFVALSGAGHRILVTHGLTYAQYARSGFFQLLACAAITLMVLLGVRACASPSRPVLVALSALTTVLTLGVVAVAVLRLQLYEAAFGLTMLRLACTVAALWIGVVFVLLGGTLVRPGLPRQYFPAAVLISGLIFVAGWGAANPAAIVARTNLGRAEHGHTFDVRHAASLGPDAVPALLAGLRDLHREQAAMLRSAICAQPAWPDEGTAFNLSKASADSARARACSRPGGPA